MEPPSVYLFTHSFLRSALHWFPSGDSALGKDLKPICSHFILEWEEKGPADRPGFGLGLHPKQQ